MKLLFKQRFFSWFDSYDIFDENGNVIFEVKGQLAWGHCLKIFDPAGRELGMVKQKLLSLMPRFDLYQGENMIGSVRKELTLLRPRYRMEGLGWQVTGSFMEWDYTITDEGGGIVAVISKELFNWTDTYSIDVLRPENALAALMFVLAIDAEKCSRGD